MNGELPNGWVWTSLGEVGEYINGRAFKPSEWEEYGRPIIRIQNLTKSSNVLNRFSGEVESKYIVKERDFLISWSATLEAFIYKGEEAILNQHIFKVNPYIHKMYLFYTVKHFMNELKLKTHRSGMVHVTKNKFEETIIPLPPLAEQQRIVNKIEELFTNLDKGIESLEDVKSKLKVYRQAILKYAMEGKLTEKWREENKDKIESASVLLEKIKEEIKKTEPYKDFPSIDTSNLVILPEGWEWERLGKIVSDKITKGSTPTSYGFSYVDKGIKFIKTENIDEKGNIQGKTDFIDIKTNNFLKRSQLKNRDLLFSIAGTIGRVGLVREKDLPANTNQALAIIRCFWNLIENKYIFYLLKSSLLQNKASQSIVGVGRANVSLTDIGFFQVPLAPLEEQKVIVERIEKLFSLADHIEETVDSKIEESKILRQSILKKAFEGKLVPQDQNDEPAEILLEKIKMEKSNKGKLAQEKLVQ